jgi:hypothetical protein
MVIWRAKQFAAESAPGYHKEVAFRGLDQRFFRFEEIGKMRLYCVSVQFFGKQEYLPALPALEQRSIALLEFVFHGVENNEMGGGFVQHAERKLEKRKCAV